MSDYDYLTRVEALVEDARQRELTRSLGQVECRALHLSWMHPCGDCGAAV